MGEEGAGFSVLLVEKDPVISFFLRKCLEENNPFSSLVDQVSSLEEALAKIRNFHYQLLFLDFESGPEADLKSLDQIHQLDHELPLVLMTNASDEVLRRKVSDWGPAELIVKSEFQFDTFSEILRRIFPERRMENFRAANRLAPHPDFVPSSVDPTVQDELTGLYTHSYLHSRIPLEYSRVTRYQYPLSCLVLDIDHFKAVNQQFGHRAGDVLLRQCAWLLFTNCRLSDIIARYGGEEFAILLPHVDYKGAQEVAQRLRTVFAEHSFSVEGTQLHLTVSIGIASYPEDAIHHCSEIVSFAGQALFRAKAIGRNSVSLYKEILPEFGKDLPSLKISENKVIEFQRRMSEIADIARKAYVDASQALILALENKDKFTAGHAANCAKYCMQVAEVLGMKVEESEIVVHATLLHDIGKICITDDILLKSERLTFEEYEKMKQHPYLGYKILKPIKFLSEEAILVLHHHEWFNGEGYPHHLKGDQIPLGSRVIAVIDSYDTMRMAGGRYRKTATVEEAVNELVAYAGIQFDPRVVNAFIEVLLSRGELVAGGYDKDRLEKALKALEISKAA